MSQNITLTSTQRDIFLAQLRYPDNPLYNIGGYIRFEYADPQRVQLAHEYMVLNHDAFGLRVTSENGNLSQHITEVRDTGLPIIDFSDAKESEVDTWLQSQFQTPFNIEDMPLFRSYLLKLSHNRFRYVSLAHHIAVDGWGFANLARLVGEYYNQSLQGQLAAKAEVSWHDMSIQDLAYTQGNKYKKDQDYWQSNLEGISNNRLLSPDLTAPFDQDKNIPSSREIRVIPVNKVIALKKLAADLNIAFSQLLMTIYGLYWTQSYRQQEIILGVPVHNRSGHKQKSKLGVFTSMSPLRFVTERGETFVSVATRVGTQMKRNFRHTKFPIGDIYRCIDRSAQTTPLYDVAFNFLHLNSDIEVEGNIADLVYLTHGHEQTPAMLNVWEYGVSNYVELQLDHNLAWFSKSTANRIIDGVIAMLEQVLITPNMPIEQISTFGQSEQTLLDELAQTGSLQPTILGNNVVEAIEHQARQHPDNIAVMDYKGQINYRTLNTRSNQFARILCEHGVKAGDNVAVSIDRDLNLPVVLIAIFKLGAAYVALDSKLPHNRLEAIVGDSSVKHVVVSDKERSKNLPAKRTVLLNLHELETRDESNFQCEIRAQDLAYIIYTSGSTGKSKGVELCHSNMMAMLNWAATEFSEQELRCVLASTSLSFDLSIFELFLPLSTGNSVYIVENALEAVISCPPVSLINTVPSAMKAWLENKSISPSVLAINLAGEPLSMAIVNEIFEQKACEKVRNLYGPSEDTTYSTCMAYRHQLDHTPAIGKVITGSSAVVLDEEGKPVPVGHVGELYLGGAGVAKGYRNQQALTSERFSTQQFFNNEQMNWYRTGDLVKLDEFGILHFIGRTDEQIKLNGFRIETGEISTVISRHSLVEDTVVIAKTQGDLKILVAYYLAANEVDHDELYVLARESLPYYMVPNQFSYISEFPLNTNGKVDKAKLPEITLVDSSATFVPSNPIQALLFELWKELLGFESITCDQSLFELGGSSILAMRLLTKINNKTDAMLTLADIFNHDTLSRQAKLIANNKIIDNKDIPLCLVENAPLSFAQKRIWYSDQLAVGPSLFNLVLSFELSGSLNVSYFNDALAELVSYHSILRTTYHLNDDVPYQTIQGGTLPKLVVEPIPAGNKQQVLEQLYQQHLSFKFDLSQDTLLRANLYNVDANKSYLFLSSHHIALDGWSINILLKELSERYNYFQEMTGCSMERAQIQSSIEYRDYSAWQLAQSNAKLVKYWQDKLQDAPKNHSLILDKPRSKLPNIDGRCLHAFIDQQQSEQLKALCEQWQVTPSILLFGLYTYLLSILGKQKDVVIGMPVLGRQHPQVENVLGVFINTLPIRCQVNDELTFKDWFLTVKSEFLDALSHQSLSFDQLAEHLELSHEQSHTPVFQLMFNYQEYSFDGLVFTDIESQRLVHTQSAVKYDVELHINPKGDVFELSWLYNQAIFDQATVEQWQQSYMVLLSGLLSEPTQQLSDINLLSHGDHVKLVDWNRSNIESDMNPSGNFIDEIVQNFDFVPNNTAFETDNRSVSYSEVSEQVNRIVKTLITKQVAQKTIIGVMLERGLLLHCTMLAALRLGITFVPLPLNFTDARLEYIAKDSGVNCIVTDDNKRAEGLEHCSIIIDVETIDLASYSNSTPVYSKFSPNDIAYILYTSGSTGSPKGVPIHYAALDNFLAAILEKIELKQSNVWLALTTNSFDISLLEWLAPLKRGDSCVLLKETQVIDPKLIIESIEHYQVNVIQATPSRWRQMLESEWSGNNDMTILTGGEALDLDLQRKLSSRCAALYNCYGPTEATIWSCVNKIDQHKPSYRRLALGKSLKNYSHIVVDEHNRLLPFGAIGELAISGISVAKNYHNLPELTQTRFFVSKEEPYKGNIYYLTGDLACLNSKGDLNYLGRIDGQIKIRGVLVEPAEVQGALCAIPEVNQAFVCALEGNTQLAAYLETNATISQKNIRQSLQRTLPSYLIPEVYEFVDVMPLTTSGKVDNKALPSITINVDFDPVHATGKTQRVLATMWAEQIKSDIELLCVETDFYILGGNSMDIVRLVRKINEYFTSIEFTVADFLADSRLCAIALKLDERSVYQGLTADTGNFANTMTI